MKLREKENLFTTHVKQFLIVIATTETPLSIEQVCKKHITIKKSQQATFARFSPSSLLTSLSPDKSA